MSDNNDRSLGRKIFENLVSGVPFSLASDDGYKLKETTQTREALEKIAGAIEKHADASTKSIQPPVQPQGNKQQESPRVFLTLDNQLWSIDQAIKKTLQLQGDASHLRYERARLMLRNTTRPFQNPRKNGVLRTEYLPQVLQARSELNELISEKILTTQATYARGYSQLLLREFSEAKKDFQFAEENCLDRQTSFAFLLHGDTLRLEGKIDKSPEKYHQFLRQPSAKPTDAHFVYSRISSIHEERGHYIRKFLLEVCTPSIFLTDKHPSNWNDPYGMPQDFEL